MRVIDERLSKRFSSEIGYLSGELADFYSLVTSVSPLTYRIVSKLSEKDLEEVRKDSSFNESELISKLNDIETEDEEKFSKGLRIIKYKELLKLIIRDVFLKQDFSKTLYEQSRLAELIVNAVYNYTKKFFLKGNVKPLTIIAMGKLGSMELNFSSDIDIVYIFDDDNLNNLDIYSRWAVKINNLLSKNTEIGFLYRVDNDLRPGGRYSPLAMSASAVLNYYYLYGETWQRMALLRTRFIAGDELVYRSLISELEGYIFKRYLDYSMIKDLKELKSKIDFESRRRDKEGLNVKLGKGGIREAEFFVYAFQIINGGKNKTIREGNISKAIDLLVDQHFLEKEKGEILKKSYLYLRRVENLIQMDDELQSYLVPSGDAFERLIKILELSKDEFFSVLNLYRKNISENFQALFYTEESDERKDFIEKEGFDREYLLNRLSQSFTADINELKPVIAEMEQKLLKFSPKYRKYYKSFLLDLVSSLENKNIQRKHLLLINEFIERLSKNQIYLPLMVENKKTTEYISKAFFLGSYLVKILINYPETLEFIVTEDQIDRKSFLSYYSYIKNLIHSAPDFEMKMRLLRQFKNSEWLKIGMMESYGVIDSYELELYLTNLAESSLFAVYELCKEIINQKLEEPDEKIAFIGMGKLGSFEMTYFSDIDLIFLYESDCNNAGYYNSRLMQRIISNLTMVTKEGELYKIDMRLRPTGSQGPLVTSFENFKNYHKTSWLFEKQALTRARVLGIPSDFNNSVTKTIEDILYGNEYDQKELKKEIYSMKLRIDKELSEKERSGKVIEIKTGIGGLMDMEFLIQYFKLAYGREHKALRALSPKDFFKALKESALIESEKVDFIEKNYLFFKAIERNLRVISGFSRNSFLKDEEIIEDIISNMNICMSKADFFEYINDIKRKIREIFIELLNG